MIHEALKYALPILLVSLVSSALVLYGWLKKNTPMGKSYSVMMLVITLWLLFFSTGLLVGPKAYRIILSLEYLTMAALPVTWLIFSASFADLRKYITAPYIILISLIPIILSGVALFSEQSGLLYNHHKLLGLDLDHTLYAVPSDPLNSMWFWLHVAFSVIYFIVGTFLFVGSLKRNNKSLDRPHLFVLILGILIPWIGNITFIFRITPIENLDLAPFVFVTAGTLIAWGLFYNQVVSIINLAHNVLIDRMGDGLLVMDKQNWILEMNLSALSIFRVNKASVTGHPAEHLFQAHPGLMKYLNQISGKNLDLELKTGEKLRYFHLDILPLYAGKGLYAGKIFLLKEITLLRETEKRLELARVQADKAETLKSAFLANLSHEIKTPMNAIIGFSELLNDASVTDEERHEFIDHIRHSGSNLLHLIDDIIDISKLDAGQIDLVSRPVDLSRIMAEMFAMVNDSLIKEGKGHVDLVLETDQLRQDLVIMGDPERIRQIITNLLDNAVKFTSKGTIEFGYYLENQRDIRFFVKDTGIGIPFDKHQLIFERFGRANTSNRQQFSGTGLGLALCKGLVKLMGGRIGFDSVYGRGSTFYFYLPYTPAEGYQAEVKPLDDVELKKPAAAAPPPDLLHPASWSEPEPEPVSAPGPEPVQEPEPEPVPEPEPEGVPEEQPEPETEPRHESIRDHMAGLPEEADYIFTPENAPRSRLEDDADLQGDKLLVIDYEDMTYLYLEMILRPTRIQIIRAKTLQQGLNLLRGGTQVTGVLVSSDLPDAELVNAIRTIREKYPRIRQIAITPFASAVKRKACLSAGALNVVPKPIKQRELLAAVRNLHVLGNM